MSYRFKYFITICVRYFIVADGRSEIDVGNFKFLDPCKKARAPP